MYTEPQIETNGCVADWNARVNGHFEERGLKAIIPQQLERGRLIMPLSRDCVSARPLLPLSSFVEFPPQRSAGSFILIKPELGCEPLSPHRKDGTQDREGLAIITPL